MTEQRESGTGVLAGPRGVWLGAGALLLAATALLFHHGRIELLDDAYISFRYAENLAAGHGLVFNLGERVEGYTNFLWVLLLAGVSRVGAPLEAASRILGGLAFLATLLAMVHWRHRRIGRAAWAALAAPLLVAASSPAPFWAVHGLETALFGLLLTLGVLSHANDAETGGSRARSGAWMGLSALTRPEGLLLGLGLEAWALLRRPAALRRADSWRSLAAFLALVVPHLLWRRWYYGAWLPNTFHAKVEPTVEVLYRGLRYAGSFFEGSGLGLGLVLAFGAIAAWRRPGRRVIAAAALAGLGIIAMEGGDAFFGFRFFAPLAPLLALVSVWGVEWLWARRGGKIWAALAVVAVAAHGVHVHRQVARVAAIDDAFTRDMKLAAAALAEALPADASIALNPVGVIPWVTGRPTIDMLGLTDRTIARTPSGGAGSGPAGHERGDGSYVLDREPDVILLGNVYLLESQPRGYRDLQWPIAWTSEREIASDARTVRDYIPRAIELADGRWLAYLERRSPSRREP